MQSFFKVKAVRFVKEEREVASWMADGPFIGTQPPCVKNIIMSTILLITTIMTRLVKEVTLACWCSFIENLPPHHHHHYQ